MKCCFGFEPGRLIQSIIRSARGVTAEIFRWCLVTMQPELSRRGEAASAGCELVTKSGPILGARVATAQTPRILACRKNSSRSGLESYPLKRPLQFLLPVCPQIKRSVSKQDQLLMTRFLWRAVP